MVNPLYAQYQRVYHTQDFEFYSSKEDGIFIEELDSLFSRELALLQNKINYYANNRLQIFLSAQESRKLGFSYSYPKDKTGEVFISDHRIIVNPNSSLIDLRLQFKEQVSKILVEQLMYGSALQDKIKSANTVNLPDWFLSGLYLYLSREWDVYCDNQLRQVYDIYGLTNFNSIPKAYSSIKGASFWKYIESSYGPNAISVLLYNSRISPKFNAAIYYSYQVPLLKIYRDWKNFYERAYQNDQKIPNPVQGIAKKRSILRDLFVISAEQYFTVEDYFLGVGVFSYGTNGTRNLIYSLNAEETFELKYHQGLCANNNTVYILCQVEDHSRLIEINSDEKVLKRDLPFYANSLSMSKQYLYLVSPRIDRSTIYSLSGGEFTELSNVEGYVNSIDSKNELIAFITDLRDTSVLCTLNSDRESKSKIIFKSSANIRQVILAGEQVFLYNSKSSGIWNGKLWSVNDKKEKCLTNYRSNILFHQYTDNVFVEYLDKGLRAELFITDHIPVSEFFIYDTITLSHFYSQRFEKKYKVKAINEEENYALEDYTFLSPISPANDFKAVDYDSLSINTRRDSDSLDVDLLAKDLYKPYSVHLKLSNDPIFSDQVVYRGNISLLTPNRVILNFGGSLSNIPENRKIRFQYGGLLQQGARDLLVGYSSTGKQTSNVSLLNRKRTYFNKTLRTAFYSTILSLDQKRYLGKQLWLNISLQGRYDLRTPLWISQESISLTSQENTTVSASTSVNFNPEKENHSLKLHATLIPMFQNQLSNWNITGLIDLSYDNEISEKIGLKSKIRLGSSQGTSPVYFILGGHRNDLRTNTTNRNFANNKNPMSYHSIYGIRGFELNYRNGNTFFLHTSEFSIKLLDYIFQRPIASEVFSNLSLHSFIDMGTSFYGKSIYDRPNLLNVRNISSSTEVIRTEVRAFKNPFIASTGIGFSSRFYGYKITVDYAWGFEDQSLRAPLMHIRLGSKF